VAHLKPSVGTVMAHLKPRLGTVAHLKPSLGTVVAHLRAGLSTVVAHLKPTQPPIQWVTVFVPGVERLRSDDHSPPSSAEIGNEWSYTSTSPDVFMVCTGTTLPLTISILALYLVKLIIYYIFRHLPLHIFRYI
jgi:hypothetical protein